MPLELKKSNSCDNIKQMSHLVMSSFFLFSKAKFSNPLPKYLDSMKKQKGNKTSHQITHLIFHFIWEVGSFLNHFFSHIATHCRDYIKPLILTLLTVPYPINFT